MGKCLLFFGLPGSGKTTLAKAVQSHLRCVHVNADWVRRSPISNDLDFSPESRIKQAERMGALANLILQSQEFVIIDFICPTEATREAFRSQLQKDTYAGHRLYAFHMDTGMPCRFPDTAQIWEPPKLFSGYYRVEKWTSDSELHREAESIGQLVRT